MGSSITEKQTPMIGIRPALSNISGGFNTPTDQIVGWRIEFARNVGKCRPAPDHGCLPLDDGMIPYKGLSLADTIGGALMYYVNSVPPDTNKGRIVFGGLI